MSGQSYPPSARLLHWAMAALILSMLFLGVSMIDSFAPWQHPARTLHQSFGILALLLVALRLANRLRFPAPALPADLAPAQRLAARASQVLLYALMIAVPLTGWAMQSAGGVPVRVFGLFTLPPITPVRLELYALFRDGHALLTWSLFGLILLHVGAALHHGLIRRDGVLAGMLGRRP